MTSQAISTTEFVASPTLARDLQSVLVAGFYPFIIGGIIKAVIAALGRASGLMRREVTQRLQLRVAPELRFVYDDGQDNSTRVEQILAEIDAERRGVK